MTALDTFILIVLLAALVLGAYRGIIVQVGSVGAVVVGILLARIGGAEVAGWIAGRDEVGTFDMVVAKFALFVIGYISVRIIVHLFRKATHALSLGFLDRFGGALFCAFEWMLILSLLLNLWFAIRPEPPVEELSTLGNGHAAKAIIELAPALLGWALN